MAHPTRAEDGALANPRHLALAAVLRQPPYLMPDDGVARAIGILRTNGGVAPVMDSLGRLVGTLTVGDLRDLTGVEDDADRLSRPIRPFIRRAPVVLGADATVPQIRDLLRQSGEEAAFVVDRDRRLIGAVFLADLLAPDPEPPRPSGAGGMATPWGVYLTTGSIQAGASNWALAAGGVAMGLMLAASYLIVGLALLGAQHAGADRVYSLWLGNQPVRNPARAIEWLCLQFLSLPVFVGFMRLSSLTRYHAAEHQAVHALERGEMLTPEALRRMPRVHPRCGTNLIAAAAVFMLVAQVASALSGSVIDPLDGAALGAVAAFLTWRRVGAFLQQHFTTSVAGQKHLASGIAAAKELQHKYVTQLPARQSAIRRLWCAGMPQTVVGVLAGLSGGGLLSRWLLGLLL